MARGMINTIGGGALQVGEITLRDKSAQVGNGFLLCNGDNSELFNYATLTQILGGVMPDYEVNAYIKSGAQNPINIWGIKINKNDSNPATRVEYINNAIGKTPVTVNQTTGVADLGDWEDFINDHFAPCMVKFDGTVDYYLDRNDQTKKIDGVTLSDVSNISYAGNAMVECKGLYPYYYSDAGYDYAIFSETPLGDYKNDIYIKMDGTTVGEAHYFSMFEGSLDSSNRIRSIAGQSPMVSQTGTTEITYATNNGTNYYTGTWNEVMFIGFILCMFGKSTNTQAIFGNGVSNVSAKINTGQTVSKGAFTGYSSGSQSVKTLWIENWWGNIWTRTAGCMNLSGSLRTKMRPPYNTTAEGYTIVGNLSTSNGYINGMTLSNNGILVTNASGSETTYYCDYYYYETGTNYLLLGGSWANSARCGAFYLGLDDAVSGVDASIGVRLSCIN